MVDFTNAGNTIHKPIVFMLNKSLQKKDRLYCSPTTFAITYFFLSKNIRDTVKLNKKIKSLFSIFNFTREDSVIMEKVKSSNFADLEDAWQYFSAEDSNVDIIITKNFFDFTSSKIPVYHPLQYINQFLI